VVWLLKDGGSGSSFAQIANATTGETATWNAALAADEWLRLSSDGQTAEVSDDDGVSWTSRPEALSGTIPKLKGGTSNTVTVSGVDGTAEWSYYAKG
jgi:hypothetical protein